MAIVQERVVVAAQEEYNAPPKLLSIGKVQQELWLNLGLSNCHNAAKADNSFGHQYSQRASTSKDHYSQDSIVTGSLLPKPITPMGAYSSKNAYLSHTSLSVP